MMTRIYGAVSRSLLDSQGRGPIARFVYSPIAEDDQIRHVGARALATDPADGRRFV